jgi:hypothetical protein
MRRLGALTAEQTAMVQANYSPEEAAQIIAQYGGGAPAGGYESLSMQVQPTANAPVQTVPVEQRIQLTQEQMATAGAPQPAASASSNWSKYALYALVGLGIYFMFIKKPSGGQE